MKTIRECTWRADLDVLTLLATRGAPFPISELSTRLICPRCRSRRMVCMFTGPAAGVPQRMTG